MSDSRYAGWHRGIVEQVGDAERRGQVRVRIPRLGQDYVTGWAAIADGLDHRQFVKGEGAAVVFEWPCRGPDNPLVIGKYSSMPGGLSEHPVEAQEAAAGPAPFGRGLLNATATNLSALGAHAPMAFDEPPHATTAQSGYNHVRKTPGCITEEWDDTPGARRLARRLALVYEDWRESGLVAKGGDLLVEFWRRGARRFVGGDSATVIAGDAQHTVEGEAQLSIGGALFAKARALSARLGTLSIVTDAKSQNPATPGADVRGTELHSRGALLLSALNDWLASGKRVALQSASTMLVSAAGDIVIDAVGALNSVTALALGLPAGSGTLTLRGKKVVLSTRPPGSLPNPLQPTVRAELDDAGVAVKSNDPLKAPLAVLILDDAAIAALETLANAPALLAAGGPLIAAIAAGRAGAPGGAGVLRLATLLRSE